MALHPDLPDEAQQRILATERDATSTDERRALFRDLARSAQEVRLLDSVLGAVTAASNIDDLVNIVGFGIKDLLPYERWSSVSLSLLDESRKQLQVYQIVGAQSSAYWSNFGKGLQAAADDLGVEVSYRMATLESTITQEMLIDQAISEGFSGIALAPMDAVALEPAIRRARQAGIPLITFDTPPIAGSAALAYVGTDNFKAGQLAGEAMARLLSDDGPVAVSVEHLQTENVRLRIQGFQKALSAAGITTLPPFESRLDRQLGYQRSRQALDEHPALAGAFGVCALNGPAWGRAVEAAGKVGSVKIVCFDLAADIAAMLKAGIVQVAVSQREYDMGYRSVRLLSQMIANGVEQTMATLAPSGIIDTDVDIVTLERTPWSVALADYLMRPSMLKADLAERVAVRQHKLPIRLLTVGILEKAEPGTVRSSARIEDESLVRRVVAAEHAIIADPALDRSGALIAANQRGSRTVVGVPLMADRGVVGVLTLESSAEQACTPEDLAVVERVAGAVVVALENARLFRQAAERRRELEEATQRQELLLQTIVDLSSPVASIVPGILVMPVVGSFDSRRAAHFIETLLNAVSSRGARVVLIDITGVSVVDTSVANYIIQSAQAVRLLGAEMVLVGITPSLAQTIVQLGIDLTLITTRADLESGFRYALRQLGGRVVYEAVGNRPKTEGHRL